MTRRTRLVLASTAVASTILLTACETTTVVDVSTVPTTVVNATTTLPAGTPAELVVQLRDLAYTLGNAIAEGGAQGRQVFAQLDALWAAAKARLPRTTFVEQVSNQMALMQQAAERRRPADADKAALHIQSLVTAELDDLVAG